jgi:hypothetical protein
VRFAGVPHGANFIREFCAPLGRVAGWQRRSWRLRGVTKSAPFCPEQVGVRGDIIRHATETLAAAGKPDNERADVGARSGSGRSREAFPRTGLAELNYQRAIDGGGVMSRNAIFGDIIPSDGGARSARRLGSDVGWLGVRGR